VERTSDAHLSLHQVMTIFHLLDHFISVTSEVTSGSCAVLLPGLQAHPTEVILALQTGNTSVYSENILYGMTHAKYLHNITNNADCG